jgi:hypothetical protein
MNAHADVEAKADDRDYAWRLIAARCPEISDVRSSEFGPPNADVVPMAIFEQRLDVIDALEERILQLEERSG